MRLIDQYILRNFLLPFAYCCVGFLAVWLVYELGTNANEFLNGGVPVGTVVWFYAGQLPSIAILILPVALLLALLYSLGRMSQSNEILAMLSAGVSLGRVLVPIFAIGLAVTGLSTYLSYAAAPQAEARRELAEAEMESGRKLERLTNTVGYLFRNRFDDRLWYIEKMPADTTKPLEGVQVVQQDANENIVTKYYAKTATFDEKSHAWNFEGGKIVHYELNGDVKDSAFPPHQTITGWSETPWRIASALLQPDKLSVPELHQYLKLNADFTDVQLAPFRTYLEYRWALPWACLVVMCFTAPLGVVYQRRSVLKGVGISILLFLLILFSDNLFRALGKGARVPAFWAAWTTDIAFGIIGLVLLRQRGLNRDRLPFTPRELWSFVIGR